MEEQNAVKSEENWKDLSETQKSAVIGVLRDFVAKCKRKEERDRINEIVNQIECSDKDSECHSDCSRWVFNPIESMIVFIHNVFREFDLEVGKSFYEGELLDLLEPNLINLPDQEIKSIESLRHFLLTSASETYRSYRDISQKILTQKAKYVVDNQPSYKLNWRTLDSGITSFLSKFEVPEAAEGSVSDVARSLVGEVVMRHKFDELADSAAALSTSTDFHIPFYYGFYINLFKLTQAVCNILQNKRERSILVAKIVDSLRSSFNPVVARIDVPVAIAKKVAKPKKVKTELKTEHVSPVKQRKLKSPKSSKPKRIKSEKIVLETPKHKDKISNKESKSKRRKRSRPIDEAHAKKPNNVKQSLWQIICNNQATAVVQTLKDILGHSEKKIEELCCEIKDSASNLQSLKAQNCDQWIIPPVASFVVFLMNEYIGRGKQLYDDMHPNTMLPRDKTIIHLLLLGLKSKNLKKKNTLLRDLMILVRSAARKEFLANSEEIIPSDESITNFFRLLGQQDPEIEFLLTTIYFADDSVLQEKESFSDSSIILLLRSQLEQLKEQFVDYPHRSGYFINIFLLRQKLGKIQRNDRKLALIISKVAEAIDNSFKLSDYSGSKKTTPKKGIKKLRVSGEGFDSSPNKSPRKKTPSGKTTPTFKGIDALFQENFLWQPCFPGKNTVPYGKREYTHLNDYELTDQVPECYVNESLSILKSSKTPTCCCANKDKDDSSECETCSKQYKYSLSLETFDTDLICKKQKVGCSSSDIFRKRPLQLNVELEETNAWGIDCYVSRNIQVILSKKTELQDENQQEMFISRLLLPVVNFVPDKVAFYLRYSLNLILAVLNRMLNFLKDTNVSTYVEKINGRNLSEWKKVAQNCSFKSVFADLEANVQVIVNNFLQVSGVDLNLTQQCCLTILKFVSGSQLDTFRVHPKGVGIRCITREGIPEGRYIVNYLGELYPAWRWFQKQDAVKNAQKKLQFKPVLPDFYNIMLEKHENDDGGYDLIFVDPIIKGNFGSRLSHSCDPNCATVVMSVDGRYVIALYAIKRISFGEELTFDYSSVSEDINEFRAAICLCGKCFKCRGSFLYYFGSGAFAAVIDEWHTALDRSAILLLACSAEISENDRKRLNHHGLKSSALGNLPNWLIKWTALILKFCEFEEVQLVKYLTKYVNPRTKRLDFTEESATLEARGVFEKRRQNILITLSKIKNFLATHYDIYSDSNNWSLVENAAPPLKFLTDEVVADLLWNNDNSKIVSGIMPFLTQQGFLPDVVLGKATSSRSVSDPQNDPELKTLATEIIKMIQEERKEKRSIGEVKEIIKKLRKMFLNCTKLSKATRVAVVDILSMCYHTKYWFTNTHYSTIKSPSISIRNVDIGKDGCVADSSKMEFKSTLDSIQAGASAEKESKSSTINQPKIDPEKVVYTEEKVFPGQFVWGQLSGWFKQTVSSPWSSISAERRGSMSLADIQCCFTKIPNGSKEEWEGRKSIIKLLETNPHRMWSSKLFWTFRNEQKIYGTPWFDTRIRRTQDFDSSSEAIAVPKLSPEFAQSEKSCLEELKEMDENYVMSK